MPIVVDEVVISVEVINEAPEGPAGGTTKTDDRQVIVDECVERVLEILQQRQER